MAKNFTIAKITDAFGKEITIYRTKDNKVAVELQYDLTGDYWWVKLKSINGPGTDGALNLTADQCIAISEILKQVAAQNEALKVVAERQTKKKRGNGLKFKDNMAIVNSYAESRTIDALHFNKGKHVRLTDGYTIIDCWPSTGRYWVKETNYHDQTEKQVVERAGESGYLPTEAKEAFELMDGIFYAANA